MKYLCLIYDEEKTFAGMSKSEIEGFMGEYFAFTEGIKQTGHYLGGERSSRSTPQQRFGSGTGTCRRPTARLLRRRSSWAGST